jgi:hypothetical protein
LNPSERPPGNRRLFIFSRRMVHEPGEANL